MNMKIAEPPDDVLGRIITKSLEDEAKQVCTPGVGEKMWDNISRRIEPPSKSGGKASSNLKNEEVAE